MPDFVNRSPEKLLAMLFRSRQVSYAPRPMNLSFSKWILTAALLGWCFGSADSLRADDPPSGNLGGAANIDLAEIARRLTRWRSSFVNLHAVWELRSLPDTDEPVVQWPAPPDPESASLFGRIEWIWADHGLDLLETRSFFYADGGSQIHSIEAFNGPKGEVFRAQFRRPTEGQPKQFTDLLVVGAGTGKPISSRNRLAFEGLYWPEYAEWLPEILSRWNWTLEGIENIGDEPCARITATQPEVGGIAFVEFLWLDLSHDCLVRRHRRPAIPGRTISWDFIVDELQQLEGGTWFPKRGRLQMGGRRMDNQVFVVTEAAVNESLDLKRFEPPSPAVGTAVNDGKTVYVYGDKTTDAEGRATAPEYVNGQMGGTASAIPTGSRWRSWSAALVGVSLVFLLVGFWLSRRS